MDRHAYAIERARLKVLEHQLRAMQADGETLRPVDLAKQIAASRAKIQAMLSDS